MHLGNEKLHGRERFNLVVVGHVDHGKSTVIGRLLADTGSLPQGKIEAVRAACERNAKPFEYAFLLDALENEQRQGITIDTARCFFKSSSRDYIIIDAPGHIEFLKNMISGAARAEAAVLVIDAKEGVQENSRRHGYMLSLLGIRQVLVLVNKMDLVDYSQDAFQAIQKEYAEFLGRIGVEPRAFVPAAAFHGENLVGKSAAMPWYTGFSLLEEIDRFDKEADLGEKPFRMPVQDVYKFTEEGDERRICAGRIEAGSISLGDKVRFLPSGKSASIKTIEAFNAPLAKTIGAGWSTGFTLSPEIYVQAGEVMVKEGEKQALVSRRLRVNIFWMGRNPLLLGRKYKLKIGSTEAPVWVEKINQVLDASDLSSGQKSQVDLHDVADCILETFKPISFDLAADCAPTGRFVLVDNYEIAGGGIILAAEENSSKLLEDHLQRREIEWERSSLTPGLRAGRYNQEATLLVLTGSNAAVLTQLGKDLEERFFAQGRFVYFLGLSNAMLGMHADAGRSERADLIHRLGETAFLFTEAGAIIIAAVADLDKAELEVISTLNKPHRTLVASKGEHFLAPEMINLTLEADEAPLESTTRISRFLQDNTILVDYIL